MTARRFFKVLCLECWLVCKVQRRGGRMIPRPAWRVHQNIEALGPKYHTCSGCWSLMPSYLGTWTLWACERSASPPGDGLHDIMASPGDVTQEERPVGCPGIITQRGMRSQILYPHWLLGPHTMIFEYLDPPGCL